MNKKNFIAFFLLCLIFSGCSNLKYLEEGQLLYVGGDVEVTGGGDNTTKSKRKLLESNMEAMLRPNPNTSILGLRPKLWFYNIAGDPPGDSGLRYWLKNKVGEGPVLFSQVNMEYNAELIQGYAENRGYFNAEAVYDSVTKNKKVKAVYKVELGNQYIIKALSFPTDTLPITAAILEDTDQSLLDVGEAYNLETIKEERIRIDANLKEKGFYYFHPDYILALVDSTAGEHTVLMDLELKDETPPRALQQYTIDNVYIYPNYSITGDTIPVTSPEAETYENFTIIDPKDIFDPILFKRSLLFEEGELYNRTDHNKSINRLVNLGIFRFVKNSFQVSDSSANTLDAYYYLTPMPKKSLRLELLAKTNSANYAGSEVNLSWSNRNTFGAAELLRVQLSAGYEAQVSGQNQGYNIFQLGAETSLTWPWLLTPFKVRSNSAFVPKTRAALGYEYQARTQLYGLNSFKTSWTYFWKENIRKEHRLAVMDINYVNPFNVSDMYREQIALNPNLARIIEEQLIFGPTYTYTFTNTMLDQREHTFYYQGNLDLAGNIAGLITGGDIDSGDPARIFGVAFSQYVKVENDFRHYWTLNPGMNLASRIIIGAGLPYGNSREMPFVKQFFVGGTNSVRAFRARSVGPGSYFRETEPSSFLADQSGDLKLELNTELRADLFSIVEGAVFVDAGNVWLVNENTNRPGAEFSEDFYKELAVGTGVGLRFDLSFLILRADLAFPLRLPYLPEGERWVFGDIDFGDGQWRKENLVFNLAIGYPF